MECIVVKEGYHQTDGPIQLLSLDCNNNNSLQESIYHKFEGTSMVYILKCTVLKLIDTINVHKYNPVLSYIILYIYIYIYITYDLSGTVVLVYINDPTWTA